jgi:hypothetical protein
VPRGENRGRSGRSPTGPPRCAYDGADEGSCWGKIVEEPVPGHTEAGSSVTVSVCEGHLPVLLGGAYQPGPNLTIQ